MFDVIHDLIQTRGAQLLARYMATGLTMLAAHLGANIDATSTAAALSSLVVAGLLMALDHYSHAKQKE